MMASEKEFRSHGDSRSALIETSRGVGEASLGYWSKS